MSPSRLAAVISASAAVMLLAGATSVVLAPLCLGRDVAAMFVALQLPWVLMAIGPIHRRHGRVACFLMGSGLLLAWGFGVQFLPDIDRAWFAPWPGTMIRAGLAGSLVLGCALIGWPNSRRIAGIQSPSIDSNERVPRPPAHSSGSAPFPFGLWLLVAIVPPALFLHSRFDAEFRRVRDLLGQSRFTEAVRTLDRLAWYPTPDRLFGVDRRTLLSEAKSAEHQTQQALSQLDQRPDRDTLIVDRARLLAMLAQEPAALELLSRMDSPTSAALILQATIRETQDHWSAARDDYQAALAPRLSAPPDEQAQALRGVAYCERKLGHPSAAEAALQQLLQLQPTADTHFLLGQFYEDAQQPTLARRHLQQAAELDPQTYQAPAADLQRKLRRAHFGCFSIPSSGS